MVHCILFVVVFSTMASVVFRFLCFLECSLCSRNIFRCNISIIVFEYNIQTDYMAIQILKVFVSYSINHQNRFSTTTLFMEYKNIETLKKIYNPSWCEG